MIRLLLIILFIIVSCTDNSTNLGKQVDASNFLPLDIGNYWIYEFSELDISNQLTGEKHIDSVLITGSKKINGENFYTVVTFRSNEAIDTSYWNADNNSIFKFANAKDVNIPGFSNTIFKMVELFKSDWFIFDYLQDSLLVDFVGEKHLFVGEFNFHGYRNYGDDTIYINNQEYVTMAIKIVQDAKYTEKNSSNTVYLHNQPTYYYYKEDIGLVLIRKESNFIVEQGNINNKIWFNGWQRQLIRYHLR